MCLFLREMLRERNGLQIYTTGSLTHFSLRDYSLVSELLTSYKSGIYLISLLVAQRLF